MQRIERYGVIALVLLLVTIAAVSFWDDGTTSDAAERGGDQRQERLAQNTARTDARTQTPKRRPSRQEAGLPSTGGPQKPAHSASVNPQRGGVASGRQNQRSNQRQKPGSGFRTVEPKVADPVLERPGANEAGRVAVTNDVEFPDLAPDPNRGGGRGAGGVRVPSGGRSAAELAEEGTRSGDRNRAVTTRPNDAQRGGESRPAPRATTYTVRSGDSLSGIASRELGTKDRVGELLALNGISNPDLIFEGQVLKLPTGDAPVGSARPVSSPAPTPAPAGGGTGVYVVKAGEVLGVIAQRELGSAKRYPDIVALNPGMDADRITEGMRLRMPSDWRRGSVVAANTSTRPLRSNRRSTTSTSNKVR